MLIIEQLDNGFPLLFVANGLQANHSVYHVATSFVNAQVKLNIHHILQEFASVCFLAALVEERHPQIENFLKVFEVFPIVVSIYLSTF